MQVFSAWAPNGESQLIAIGKIALTRELEGLGVVVVEPDRTVRIESKRSASSELVRGLTIL